MRRACKILSTFEALEPRLLFSRTLPSLGDLLPAQTLGLSATADYSISGRVDSTQPDAVYRFTAPASGRFLIEMTSQDGSVDPYLMAFNDRGRRLRWNDNARRGTQDSRMVLRVREGRDYLVMPTSADGTEGAYTLRFVGDPVDDMGNTFDEAKRLRVSRRGAARGRGRINYGSDTDVMTFTAVKSGRMRLDLRVAGRRNNLDAAPFVYDSSGALLATHNGPAGDLNGQSALSFDVEADQQYFLATASREQTSGIYSMRVVTESENPPQPGPTPSPIGPANILPGGYFDPYVEPGDYEIGSILARGAPAKAYLYAVADATVDLRIDPRRADRNVQEITVSVHSPSGQRVAQFATSVYEDITGRFTAPVTGIYELTIDQGLNTTRLSAENARLFYKAERGNPLLLLGEHPRLYFFVPFQAGAFRVRAWGKYLRQQVKASVFDAQGNLVASDESGQGNDASLTIQVPNGQAGRIWSLRLDRPERDPDFVIRNVLVELDGDVVPYLAQDPTDLVAPLLLPSEDIVIRYGAGAFESVSVLTPLASPIASAFQAEISVCHPDGRLISVVVREHMDKSRIEISPEEFNLPVGSYIASVRITSRGELVAEHQFPTVTVVNERPSALREDNVLLDETGSPYMPLGLYRVGDPQDYPLIKAQGFNMVKARPHTLDAVHAAGLKAAVELYPNATVDLDYIRYTVTKFKDHPAVAVWMIMNEPDSHDVSPELMSQAYGLIRQLDPDHPAYTVICSPDAYDAYSQTTDVFAIDRYPVPRNPIFKVVKQLEKAERLSANQPVWFVSQAWSWPGLRNITPAETRCLSYIALTRANVKGMFWYAFDELGWHLPDSAPQVWEALGQVTGEIAAMQQMWLTDTVWEGAVNADGVDLYASQRQYDGSSYMLVVNPTDQAVSATIDLPGAASAQAESIFDGRQINVTGGSVQDHVGAFGVKLYRYTPN